jgi:two-component system phosphate regulon response regulator PhoB
LTDTGPVDRQPVILVAEDDESVRMTLEFVLEDEGFEVLLAADGEEALGIALDRLPDAILLDQLMPKLNGRQVLDVLQVRDETRSIPVFILSGMDPTLRMSGVEGDVGDQWRGAQFVGKPFDPEELVASIRRALVGP